LAEQEVDTRRAASERPADLEELVDPEELEASGESCGREGSRVTESYVGPRPCHDRLWAGRSPRSRTSSEVEETTSINEEKEELSSSTRWAAGTAGAAGQRWADRGKRRDSISRSCAPSRMTANAASSFLAKERNTERVWPRPESTQPAPATRSG